jgi:hypothetical protein
MPTQQAQAHRKDITHATHPNPHHHPVRHLDHRSDMSVTITLGDEYADHIRSLAADESRPVAFHVYWQVANTIGNLIDQSRAALASAPIDGSGAHGVEETCTCGAFAIDDSEEFEIGRTIHRHRPNTCSPSIRCECCGHGTEHYPDCRYHAGNVARTPLDKRYSNDIPVYSPTRTAYGWVK